MKDTFLTVAALWLKKKSSDFSLPRFSVVSSASQKNSVCFFYTDSSDSEKKNVNSTLLLFVPQLYSHTEKKYYSTCLLVYNFMITFVKLLWIFVFLSFFF